MRIRPANNQDADAIRRVVFGVLAEYGLTTEHRGVDVDLEDIAGNYFARGGLFEVVEDGERGIVGCVGLFAKEDGVCELRKMYLLPDMRGKGIGRQLLERMLMEARQRGFKRMELETSSKLVEATAMYRRYGFTSYRATHFAMRCDEAFYLDLSATSPTPPHCDQQNLKP